MSRALFGSPRQLGGTLRTSTPTQHSSCYSTVPFASPSALPSCSRNPSSLPVLRVQARALSRHLHNTPPTMMVSADTASSGEGEKKKDWSATQYLKFNNERTQPVRDLVARIKPLLANPRPRIFDLGCGPGNSTAVLKEMWPGSDITGIDNSPDMLDKARTKFCVTQDGDTKGDAEGTVDFRTGDLTDIATSSGSSEKYSNVDLIFSNAAFHWLRSPTRLNTIRNTFKALAPGGVIALQVPDNYYSATHRAMRNTALAESRPWFSYFADAKVGVLEQKDRPDLDPIEPPAAWYNVLSPLAAGNEGLQIWRAEYMHILPNAHAIVEWVKGTGLQPFLHRMEGDEEAKVAYLREYERRITSAYRPLGDEGAKLMLGYRRLFVVGVRG
ncbi:hypothetical protein NX059_004183 [Plenodomus lindquistii]|nr:hypothetical protein NX059_004183 [Plenodomus lindquistii]